MVIGLLSGAFLTSKCDFIFFICLVGNVLITKLSVSNHINSATSKRGQIGAVTLFKFGEFWVPFFCLYRIVGNFFLVRNIFIAFNLPNDCSRRIIV